MEVGGVDGLGSCSSDPKKVVEPDAVASDVDLKVGKGTVTVKLPDGAGIGVATVAGEAGVTDLVADVDAKLEAFDFSVSPGKTSDPFFCFFWVLSDLPIFWRGFTNSPTF